MNSLKPPVRADFDEPRGPMETVKQFWETNFNSPEYEELITGLPSHFFGTASQCSAGNEEKELDRHDEASGAKPSVFVNKDNPYTREVERFKKKIDSGGLKLLEIKPRETNPSEAIVLVDYEDPEFRGVVDSKYFYLTKRENGLWKVVAIEWGQPGINPNFGKACD
ncbi:MAG: hypothetical protein R2684_14420 [Pyrinomonadaceae bacterium]